MMYNFYQGGIDNAIDWGGVMPWGSFGMIGGMFTLFVTFALWSIVWKGLALWHAAQAKKPWWFIAILLINTVGILEIFYLFAIEKKKFSELLVADKRSEHHKE